MDSMIRKLRRYNLPISSKMLREVKRLARAREVSTPHLIREFIRKGLDNAQTATVDTVGTTREQTAHGTAST